MKRMNRWWLAWQKWIDELGETSNMRRAWQSRWDQKSMEIEVRYGSRKICSLIVSWCDQDVVSFFNCRLRAEISSSSSFLMKKTVILGKSLIVAALTEFSCIYHHYASELLRCSTKLLSLQTFTYLKIVIRYRRDLVLLRCHPIP